MADGLVVIIGKKDDIFCLAQADQDQQNADDLQQLYMISVEFASLIKSI